MKKISLLLILTTNFLVAQNNFLTKDDVNLPEQSQGSVLNLGANINESTGKVNSSLPIAEIQARSVSYSVNLAYNGSNVFKQAQFKNKYLSTGVLGVGWNMESPRIIANTKETASRDDDTFYLNGVELICTKRPTPEENMTGTKVWEFMPKKQMPYIVKYYQLNVSLNFSNFVVTDLDYWEVVDDKGYTYIYGNNQNSRNYLLAWDNWIGDSNVAVNAKQHTQVWNLAEMKDQWDNSLLFKYLKVEQATRFGGPLHTEASYISEIISSTGEKIVFDYGNKDATEFYEPNIQSPEPDAFQEIYEKKYLASIKSFNSDGSLISTHEFSYELRKPDLANSDYKRFMVAVKKKNSNGNNLPGQKYDYYSSGPFFGALKSKINADGGTVGYEYTENDLFVNNNLIDFNGVTIPSGSVHFGTYNNNNYNLSLYTNGNDLPGISYQGRRESSFFVLRDVWNGRKWVRTKFIIPQNIGVNTKSGYLHTLDNAKFIFDENFYAILCFDRGTKLGTAHLFHLKEDGTWSQTSYGSLSTGGVSNADFTQDPVLLAGDNFVAVGTRVNGKLYAFDWNGDSWNYQSITQNAGLFNYAAKNNFILTLDSQTGVDMPTNDFPNSPNSHYDKYYIHYLDGEKKWRVKSWTNFATQRIGDVSGFSYFYPNNANTSLAAANNPELFLRWDKNYNLIAVDNFFGNYNDNYPIFPVANNVFAGYRVGDIGRPYVFKTTAFNGSQWATSGNLYWETTSGFGKNRILGLGDGPQNTLQHMMGKYNPNTSSWTYSSLPKIENQFFSHNLDSYAVANDFFMAGHNIFKITNLNNDPLLTAASNFSYAESASSGGGEYIYATFWSLGANSTKPGETKYFYTDKRDDILKTVILSNAYTNKWESSNRRAEQFGGKFPFFSSKNMKGRRLIDNLFNNTVKDIVVSRITVDDATGKIYQTEFNYADSNTTMDDSNVIYGVVNIKQIGQNGSLNGFLRKTYDNGSLNPSRSGLLLKEEYYNNDNVLERSIVNTYDSTINSIWNSKNIVTGTYIVNFKTSMEEKNWVSGNFIVTITDYTYDINGNVLSIEKKNSLGVPEKTSIVYAHTRYPFVNNKNFIGFVYKKEHFVNSGLVSMEVIEWTENAGKIYINKNKSGTSQPLLRVNNEIKVVDAYGNVLETSNGSGISNTVLMGYKNKYVVAKIQNATYDEVIGNLEVPYANLQNMDSENLKVELLKLQQNLLKASVTIDIYDASGRVVNSIDPRKNQIFYEYDEYGRLKYVLDGRKRVVKAHSYNYKQSN